MLSVYTQGMLSKERAVTVVLSPWPAIVQEALATMPAIISIASPVEGRVEPWCKPSAVRQLPCNKRTKSHRIRYDSGNTKQRNLVQSGCQSSNSRSVCNSLPFSQAFHDLQNITPGDMSFNCDAWPMASIKQNDFVQGQVRNSLRCIDSSENSSKLTDFITASSPLSRVLIFGRR